MAQPKKPGVRYVAPEEIRKVAKAAADETVNRVFLHLGVDVDNPDTLVAMRKDFNHLRAWRESTETVKKAGLWAAAGIFTAGVIGLIWRAVKG